MTNKLFICHRFFFFLPILLYLFIFMTIKSLEKRKRNNKSIYRDFPNSYYLTVNCQEVNLRLTARLRLKRGTVNLRFDALRARLRFNRLPPQTGGKKILPGASTAFSIVLFIDKLLVVLAPGSLR